MRHFILCALGVDVCDGEFLVLFQMCLQLLGCLDVDCPPLAVICKRRPVNHSEQTDSLQLRDNPLPLPLCLPRQPRRTLRRNRFWLWFVLIKRSFSRIAFQNFQGCRFWRSSSNRHHPQLLSKGTCEFREILRETDRKSTRLNSSHVRISYAVF